MPLLAPSVREDEKLREAKAKWIDSEDQRNAAGQQAHKNRLSRFADACKEKLAPKIAEIIPRSKSFTVPDLPWTRKNKSF